MSRLSESLASGRFTVTAELNPPKGINLTPLFEKADLLNGKISAFNLTDSHTARMSMSPLAVAKLLLERGVEPILQITCRDRNRIALQGDLLGASALGITNLLCMTGDDPTIGDHPDTKPVFDVDVMILLKAIQSLQDGQDLGGSKLRGSPSFLTGAVVNPGASDLPRELHRMEEKIQAGTQFFQTQAVYEPAGFEKFMESASAYNVPILPSIIMLKSGNMARNFNENVPGISIPDEMIAEMDNAADPAEKSVELSIRIIQQVRPMCQGIHIIAAGWESRIPQILEGADL